MEKSMAKAKKRFCRVAKKGGWIKDFASNWPLYLIFLIPAAYFIVFNYVPMFGVLMAFQEFRVAKGFFGSDWVGFENFKQLFTSPEFPLAFRNTCMMALLNLTLGFIAPVILALLISQLRSKRMARGVQTVTYMPYFVSTVVCTSLAAMFLDSNGAITKVLSVFGLPERNWIAYNSPSFWFINCFIEIWQGMGYGAIIYIATISGINKDYYDAASIDGANRWRMLTNVTVPSILSTIIMMFTLKIGTIFMTGFDKILLLYMPTTYEYADVMHSLTHRLAFGQTNGYSVSTASGLFQSVIGTALMLAGNKLSAKLAKTSVF